MTKTENEIKELRDWASAKGREVSLADGWGKGGEGGQDLACKVVKQIDNNQGKQQFRFLYDLNLTIREKMDIIAKEIYGARLVEYSTKALTQIRNYERLGWDKLPICVAKTQYSLSDDPKLMGRPTDFFLNVREFKPSLGAGFLVALTGDVMTMPGLPKKPAALQMNVIDNKIVGLF